MWFRAIPFLSMVKFIDCYHLTCQIKLIAIYIYIYTQWLPPLEALERFSLTFVDRLYIPSHETENSILSLLLLEPRVVDVPLNMAPRHDRTPSLTGNNTSATRLRYSGSSSTTCYNESLRQLDILSRNYTSVREDSKKRKPSQSTKLKKVSFNLKNALRSGQVRYKFCMALRVLSYLEFMRIWISSTRL